MNWFLITMEAQVRPDQEERLLLAYEHRAPELTRLLDGWPYEAVLWNMQAKLERLPLSAPLAARGERRAESTGTVGLDPLPK